jgi:phospholipid/cholesterol/gamma-HCH transport system substrate-binding protein
MDLLVGLFVLAGIGALFFLAVRAANLGSFVVKDGYELRANFDNIGGLKERAPVRSAGVVVGRVDSIDFDTKSFQADVRLSMDNRYRFPKDSSVKILTAGLLGEQYIGIEAGADEKVLGNGDKVALTQSAVVLENLISQFLYGKAAEGEPANAAAGGAGGAGGGGAPGGTAAGAAGGTAGGGAGGGAAGAAGGAGK